MPSPIETINEAMATAIAAQEAGEFTVAERKARTAWMLVSSLPDSELSDERLRWKPESIEPIVKDLARLAQAQGNASSSRGALFRDIEIDYARG